MAVGVAFLYHRIGIAAILLFGIVPTYQYLLGPAPEQRRGARAAVRSSRTTATATALADAPALLRTSTSGPHDGAALGGGRSLRAEIAIAAGFSKEDQDLVHTAGLLHDLGKFIFPDRILKGDSKLSDEDWNIIKMHPYQGPGGGADGGLRSGERDHPRPPRADRRQGLSAA